MISTTRTKGRFTTSCNYALSQPLSLALMDFKPRRVKGANHVEQLPKDPIG